MKRKIRNDEAKKEMFDLIELIEVKKIVHLENLAGEFVKGFANLKPNPEHVLRPEHAP
jgi:hypothetical protein